jgi:hypothetical protein
MRGVRYASATEVKPLDSARYNHFAITQLCDCDGYRTGLARTSPVENCDNSHLGTAFTMFADLWDRETCVKPIERAAGERSKSHVNLQGRQDCAQSA